MLTAKMLNELCKDELMPCASISTERFNTRTDTKEIKSIQAQETAVASAFAAEKAMIRKLSTGKSKSREIRTSAAAHRTGPFNRN